MPVRKGRITISAAAEANYLADVALAANFNDLLARAQVAEQEYRQAQATRAPGSVQYQLAHDLDVALTDVTRAAYAAQRAEIGPAGYEDRIYFRKAKATSAVRPLTAEAERLLTLRETHRLTGFPARPGAAAIGAEIARLPAGDDI
jgi:site-specific DNA-cytosine methylase